MRRRAPPQTLKRRSDYLAARRGASFGTPGFLMIRRSRDDGAPVRFGYTITKKMGPAVTRNLMRRRLKEAVRLVYCDVDMMGSDVVLIARPAAARRAFPLLLDDVKRALLRLRKDTN